MNTQATRSPRSQRENRSQALVEFAMILPIFLTLMCGVFDYGWMIGNANTLASAARESANTASRQKLQPMLRGLQAGVDVSRPRLDMTSVNGGIILTKVVYDTDISPLFATVPPPLAESCVSTGLLYGGGDALKNKSKILFNNTAWDENTLRDLPFDADNLAEGQQMICAEVYYTNEFVTPIGTLIGLITPPRLYDSAYF